MTLTDEQHLLQQARQKDETSAAAYGELVRRYQTAVFNTAYRLLGRRVEAEDAAQEAFLRAYRALDRFELGRPFAPWIKRITTNLCLNWLESSRAKTQLLAADMSRNDQPVSLDDWAQSAPSPEQTLVRAEQSTQLHQAILALPPRYRVAIELRHFQELSYDEMAAMMERPLSSVKSDLFRARKMLAEKMKESA
ncbi:RNA polymerase sigma factor [Candidatus Leptofilum sp.]|uniref:RNA polymerase sigma factor n=1 Tax=Candidatus Leptofilum sp. TaxID=3241576 RepID=UPI003B58E1E4